MAVSTSVVLKGDQKNRDGTKTVYFQLTINRKVQRRSIGIKIHEKSWDPLRKVIKGRTGTAELDNGKIFRTLHKARQIIDELEKYGGTITFNRFWQKFDNKENSDFYDFAEKFVERKDQEYSHETLRQKKAEITKLKQFSPKLSLYDIDLNFLEKYENWMRKEKGNVTNTVNKSMKFVRLITNEAIKKELIKKSPFDHYKIKAAPGSKCFLTEEELMNLKELYNSGTLTDKHKNVLRYFLFACYTGLRFADIKALTYGDIHNNIIRVSMNKGRIKKDLNMVMIPVRGFALELINQNPAQEGFIFRTLSNQKTNEYLKEISIKAGINKKVTFHVSRHTFATIGLTIGMPIEVISKLLGHSNIKVTQVYAKIVDKLLEKEMEKWDKL